MLDRLRQKLEVFNNTRWLKNFSNEKWLIIASVVISVCLTLWIASHDGSKGDSTIDPELSLIIPKGFLVVPLELANATALAALVSHTAVVDVFAPGEARALAENLRIIKLLAGEGPLFGALIPEKIAGSIQEVFSRPKLRAAVRTLNSKPSIFHVNNSAKPLLIEVSTGD